MIWDWLFWITVWWMVWFYIFIAWYSNQIENGVKTHVSKTEAFFMFVLSGFGPILAIAIILGKALAPNNRDEGDK